VARAIPLAILAVTGYAAFYLAACAIFPFGNCRRCHGTGQRRSPTGRSFRLCRRCEATGRRVRIGRRVYDYFRNEYERGSK